MLLGSGLPPAVGGERQAGREEAISPLSTPLHGRQVGGQLPQVHILIGSLPSSPPKDLVNKIVIIILIYVYRHFACGGAVLP